MSTTGEASDFDGFGQPATSHSAAVSNSSLPDMERWCSECHPELYSVAVVFCLSCKQPLCAACNENVVHTSKATRNHLRMKMKEYLMVERGLGHSSPTVDEIHADDKNKFCFFSPIDHHIHLQPLLASLIADPNAQPSLAAFIGPTGVGKSTVLRLLVSLDGETDAGHMPLAGAPTDAQSTSTDIHMYPGGQVPILVQSAVDSTYPLLYVDSEGSGGSKEPRGIQSVWKASRIYYHTKAGKYEVFQKTRFDHVQLSYPRMLYIFADVLCFVFSGDWREKESIIKPLLQWGRRAAVGAANQHRPQLILIFNKTGSEAAKPQFDDFRGTYKKWIEGDNTSHDELQRYYFKPLVCLIPHMDIDAGAILHRVRKLRAEIHECTTCIRGSREKANQLFTRRQLQLHMQLATDTFNKDPNGEFDIYTASMARRPPSGKLSDYIVDFRRAVEQANLQCTSKSEGYQTSLSIIRERIKLSVLLWISRLSVNVPVGPYAELPKDLRKALEEAQTVIDGEQPCAAQIQSGRLSCHCDTVRHMHACAPHASVRNGKAVRWDGEFIAYSEVQHTINDYRLIKLAEEALWDEKSLDVKKIRIGLSEVRKCECDNYPWLQSFTFYRVCVSCMVELPTEVLSCGHIICAMCSKEEADLYLEILGDTNLTCPVCLTDAKWFPKDLPPLAGYRILSLDGGGVRGIVELLSLEKIMSYFPDMHVKDLFDIIIGTSTGGIIALALTVHALHEQPKCLPEVIKLFHDFCREVFSSQMLRFGASYDITLRVFQFLRIYDTKYKNDNLLKLLKENFGEQPLLSSCVGGPHVIVTSCDRDNNLAGAWFTSYNRKILDNECDDLPEQAVRKETEQPTRKLIFGRVPNNHLFSAKDAAAATSAAGTYFPSYEAGNQWWIDGGLRFNCPAEIAIREAQTMSRKHRTIALISLGCGQLSYDTKPQHSESLIYFLKSVVDVVTDSETQCNAAMEDLKRLQPNSSGCSVRLNPTIKVPKGKKCELDHANEIPFLTAETKKYLDTDGLAYVHEAANLLFASLFYLDDGIDQDSLGTNLDRLSIRSRAALPDSLRKALMNASSPPFSVAVHTPFGVESEFLWDDCTWDQNVMNLPFKLVGLSMVRSLVVEVKLHMRLPGTTAPKEWPLGISGMPCKLGAAYQ